MLDSKFIPWATVRDHYATLVDQNHPDRPYWPDYVVLLGVPIVTGTLTGCITKQPRDMAAFIGGVAVFTALLFALVIYLFQLRMQLLENPNVPRDGKLATFIDQVFANVSYAVVVGVVTTAISMAVAMTTPDSGHINRFCAGLVVGLGAHLMLVVLMCIKRLRAAYREIKALPRNTRV
ncbi:hypothetical protein NJB18091_45040 [Mycobacterium marinum]|uniref:hypothetical protein n=1 Tax=Mycobacterium marinum TaxID=1781 RepID=UPI0021C2FF92|nr:hypothetical protein [Mycobacterium marinum]GJO05417.1 hypothetical protein NJB18091_45040 [Mycobacterium marinum]